MKLLRAEIVPVLMELEAQDVDAFDMGQQGPRGERPDPTAPWARLAPFGVRRGRVWPFNGPPTVFMGSSGAFSTAASVVDALVILELTKPDNALKVGTDGHLFVWVESLSHQTHMGHGARLSTERSPSDPCSRQRVGCPATRWVGAVGAGPALATSAGQRVGEVGGRSPRGMTGIYTIRLGR